MEFRFIINRFAGAGIGRKYLARMESYFRHRLGSFKHILPDNREQAVMAAKDFVRRGIERIVVVGGDGSINAVVNGFFENGRIINDQAALIVAKGGCGGDYYSSVTKDNPPVSWMDVVTDHRLGPVDVGVIDYDNEFCGRRYFVNMASVGMIPDIVRKKENAKYPLPAKLRYVVPTMASLFTYKPFEVEIVTEKGVFSYNALTVSVSKGAYAGGGMLFGLGVNLNDGVFEVTIFEKTNPLSMALKLGKMFTGSYGEQDGVRKIISSRVEIRTERPLPSECDGEPYGSTNLTVFTLPKAIQVCFPV